VLYQKGYSSLAALMLADVKHSRHHPATTQKGIQSNSQSKHMKQQNKHNKQNDASGSDKLD
jgi:hypothetical protein